MTEVYDTQLFYNRWPRGGKGIYIIINGKNEYIMNTCYNTICIKQQIY